MTVEDEVRAVSAAFAVALVSNDASLVAGFMTDDWVYVGPTGATPRPTSSDGSSRAGWCTTTMVVVGGERVARAADAVLLTSHKASSSMWEGEPYAADEWISEVYVYTDGAWRCAISPKTSAV